MRAYLDYGRVTIPWKVVIFLACTLPLVWGMVILEVRQIRSIAEQESQRDAYNYSLAFAHEVKATVNTIDLSLIGLRANWMRNRTDFRDIVNRLQVLLKNDVIFQISVTNAAGDLVFTSNNPSPAAVNLADREHIRIHSQRKEDALYISRPLEGRISRKWTVQFTRPVYTMDGRFDGVVIASIEPAYFSRFYRQLDLGKDASVTLALAEGTVLAGASHASQDIAMGMMLAKPTAEERLNAESGHFRALSQFDGIDKFFAWRKLPGYGLLVIVSQSVEEGYARYAHQESAYVRTGIAVSFVLIGLGFALAFASRYRQQAMQALADAETRLKLALQGAREGVWDWDLARQSANLSERAQEIMQVDQPVLPCTLASLQDSLHPDDLPMVTKALAAHLSGKAPDYSVEHRVRARDGGWIWILVRGMVIERAQDGRALRMVGTFLETTERRSREENTIYIAHHDRLTRLPNRWLFSDRMQQALLRSSREKTRLGVIYFDLDKFKPVNDRYGHEMGDKLLRAVAERTRKCLRESDTIARLGGDEFAVLLPKIATEADAVKVARTILQNLNQPFNIDGVRLDISGSVGIATYPLDGADEETLLRNADTAMYHAKREGRNRVCRYAPKTILNNQEPQRRTERI
jgi:diguanylate cyclase (GGDEF)-like protein